MQKIIPIIRLADKLREVKRTVKHSDGIFENDSEHSYQVALVCWSANKQYNLGLNDELILKFALVHDLVEAYAGDVDAFDNKEEIKNKEENERKAFEDLKNEVGEFEDMVEMIERYEKKQDLEAELVYVLDKLMVDVNVYYRQDNYYRDRKITINDWKEWLLNKLNYEKLSPQVKSLVDELINKTKIEFKDNFYQNS